MQIHLVRHGRSAHVESGWLDLAGFLRWREAYEAAGIDERDPPPAEWKELAAASGAIVASTAPRAIHSAALLDARRGIITSPLLAELELPPPNLRRIRMPLLAWALVFGVRYLLRRHASAAERQRAGEAAAWLVDLAQEHGSVLAVTHGSFRSVLAEQLVARGWSCDTPRKSTRHWSNWRFRGPEV